MSTLSDSTRITRVCTICGDQAVLTNGEDMTVEYNGDASTRSITLHIEGPLPACDCTQTFTPVPAPQPRLQEDTIHKFPLTPLGVTHIRMPTGSVVLHVSEQRSGELWMWAQRPLHLPDDDTLEDRVFAVFGTGHEIPAVERDYVASTVMRDGLVWHVYELH